MKRLHHLLSMYWVNFYVTFLLFRTKQSTPHVFIVRFWVRVTTIYQLTIECCLSILMYVLWNAATSGSVELDVEASGLNLRMTESGMSDGWMMVGCMTDHQCRVSVVLNQMTSQALEKSTQPSKIFPSF